MFLFIEEDGTPIQKETIEDADLESVCAGIMTIYKCDDIGNFQEINTEGIWLGIEII